MNILGLSAFFHDSACCLIQRGEVRAAASEERFTRIKQDARLPVRAFRYCLQAGGLGIIDLDAIGYYELPRRKLARQIGSGPRVDDRELFWLDPERPRLEIRERLGFEGPILAFPHHLSHAASAFFPSGFESAAILTVDGVGEWTTAAFGAADGKGFRWRHAWDFPASLGLFYSTITNYLGFAVNRGEYKVMGLAAYGRPRFRSELESVASLARSSDGFPDLGLDLRYFDFLQGQRMFSGRLPELLGRPPRTPESEITTFHQDVAASVQQLLEDYLLAMAESLHEKTGQRRLCLAGGVALNAAANGRLVDEGPFDEVFVQPAAGDAGASLGAAALAYAHLTGQRPCWTPMVHACFGPRYGMDELRPLLARLGLSGRSFEGQEFELLEEVADRLARGEVVGWFHGPMEFGPRALGGRSLLADPRRPDIAERLNRLVKRREGFRPFAPMVLAERASEYFELDPNDPTARFMLRTCRVRPSADLPAITHVDGTARPQVVDRWSLPRVAALLDAFELRTGRPVLLNTSFNQRGEPIVCSPVDALSAAVRCGVDALVLEDFLLDRRDLPFDRLETLEHWASTGSRDRGSRNLYSLT